MTTKTFCIYFSFVEKESNQQQQHAVIFRRESRGGTVLVMNWKTVIRNWQGNIKTRSMIKWWGLWFPPEGWLWNVFWLSARSNYPEFLHVIMYIIIGYGQWMMAIFSNFNTLSWQTDRQFNSQNNIFLSFKAGQQWHPTNYFPTKSTLYIYRCYTHFYTKIYIHHWSYYAI